jgi:hypothetical protein
MSQENVENLRAYLEIRNGETLRPEARPWEAIDISLLDPDVTFEDTVLPTTLARRSAATRPWSGRRNPGSSLSSGC